MSGRRKSYTFGVAFRKLHGKLQLSWIDYIKAKVDFDSRNGQCEASQSTAGETTIYLDNWLCVNAQERLNERRLGRVVDIITLAVRSRFET